ncbi:GNAT family N-acetyltransferase [Nocardioides acrostichi]|uniref:GNAT family N-acetyltransferase n=1 Tax=Nocardioides acrostichi TaxID=2784339 RepID=A0A930V555_9ACTN|nr:GNAT family N-acetyltransferase [Nocardioides acrostichi]MBF4163935.1 GNAT family N-acetyltransferase [Nocardioides acrostichi]
MARRIVPLTPDRFADLPWGCHDCLFWELDPVRRADFVSSDQRTREKATWISEVLREWGSCGRVVEVDGDPVGVVLYAPPAYLPGSAGFATAPVSVDAVQMTVLWVHEVHRGGGLARMLVQGMARDLVGRPGVKAVESFGRIGVTPTPCTTSVEVLGRLGFRTRRAHPLTPRMRMDLRATVTWRGEVEAAIERIAGAVRSAPAPARRDGTISPRSPSAR